MMFVISYQLYEINGNKLPKRDPSFAVPVKEGISRQASVYFDHTELVEWWENKKKVRHS